MKEPTKNNMIVEVKQVDSLGMLVDEWFKPTPNNRIREFTKARALIAAEIDRL